MTILDALMKLTGGLAGLEGLLVYAKNNPDLAPIAELWLLRLNESLSPAALTALAAELPTELMDILKGDFKPKDHPSDSV